MRFHLGVSLFHSPTGAFGNVSGEMDLPALPRMGQPFPWPTEWVAAKPTFFSPEQSRIVGVSEVNGLPLVVLDGIVCSTADEARDCASFLEHEAGLFFDEYAE